MDIMEEFEERLAAEPYEVSIEKTRWAYWVTISHGLVSLGGEYGGRHKWTKKSAERWANRVIEKDKEQARKRREAIRYEV